MGNFKAHKRPPDMLKISTEASVSVVLKANRIYVISCLPIISHNR